MQIISTFADQVEKLVHEHAPGWHARVLGDEEIKGVRKVEISKPLSDGFEIGSSSAPLTLERVERWLTQDPVAWYIDLLSTAPDPENPEVLRSVLRYTEMFAWTNVEVKAIVSMLADVNAISDEEYNWLRTTVGDGAPNRPRQNKVEMVYRDYRYRKKA